MKIDDRLENSEIKRRIFAYSYSGSYKPSVKLVDNILQQFWFHDYYSSFISDEFVLTHLITFLDKTHPRTFNRYDFYKNYFDSTTPVNLRPDLHKLGLAFEKLQNDAIKPHEYEELIEKIGLSKEKFSIDSLRHYHLADLGERDSVQLLIWSQHTLTEFLAAEYLASQNNPATTFSDLAILSQEGIVAFKPSWSGVLRFILESSCKDQILDWLLTFLEQNQDSLDDNLSELIVYMNAKPKPSIKSRIFNLIYNSYFERVVWLPTWASSDIARFVGVDEYARIKSDLKEWPGRVETYVKRGNAIVIVEGLLKEKNSLLNRKELAFWRKTLIYFATHPSDDGNGVIQRHSLGALAQYHDEKIIPLVGKVCFDETKDTLVQDEFINFCISTAPESREAINYLIKGVKGSSTIYGRHGLYKIKSKEAIKYFLKTISTDEQFLRQFIDKESIFDKEDGDSTLYKNIKSVRDKSIVKLLKTIIHTIFSLKDFYPETKSNFLQFLATTTLDEEPYYSLEIIKEIAQSADDEKALYRYLDYDNLLALLLTPDNLMAYLEAMQSLPAKVASRKLDPIYSASYYGGEKGQRTFDKAVEMGLIQKRQEPEESPFDLKRKKDAYQKFLTFLEPTPGKYIPSVFQHYVENRELIEKNWSDKEKSKLIKLAITEGIAKIDPRSIKVTFNDKTTRNFTWTSVAAYYGDILQVVKILAPEEIINHRQDIINFIPYAFSDDMSLILELIPSVTDEELSDVNRIMSDKTQDTRYLIPGSYIYMIGQYLKSGNHIPGASLVLRSFIGDPQISNHDQLSALQKLESFIVSDSLEDKGWLQNLHSTYLDNEDSKQLSYFANDLLIRIYKDEESIEWRLNEVKKPKPFSPPVSGVVHSVGPTEHELHSMTFAKPLIELRDATYLPRFLNLLESSFAIQAEHNSDKSYWEYTNYLWRIVIGYLENLKENKSFSPLLEVEQWVKSRNQLENSNWLLSRIVEVRKSFINELGKSTTQGL